MTTEELFPESVVTAGLWTVVGSDAISAVNEPYGTPDDADYITIVDTGDADDYIEYKVKAPHGSPIHSATGMVLKFRHKATTGGIVTLGVRVLDGATSVRSNSYNAPAGWTSRSLTYTKAHMDSFSNWSDLRIRIYPNTTGDAHFVSQLSFLLETRDGVWSLPMEKIG